MQGTSSLLQPEAGLGHRHKVHVFSLHQEQHPAPSHRDKGVSRTTYQAAQVQMHKEGKPAPLSPLAAFSSDMEKSPWKLPHLHHTWVSGLQNKQLKKVLCSPACCCELEGTFRYGHGFHSMGRCLQFLHPQDGKVA